MSAIRLCTGDVWPFGDCTRAHTHELGLFSCFEHTKTNWPRMGSMKWQQLERKRNFAWKGGWPAAWSSKTTANQQNNWQSKCIGVCRFSHLTVSVYNRTIWFFEDDAVFSFPKKTQQTRAMHKYTSALCNLPIDSARIYDHNKSIRWTKHFKKSPFGVSRLIIDDFNSSLSRMSLVPCFYF